MFDGLTIRDPLPILWLKRAFVAVIVLLLAIGAVSSHRAYFQVRSLELKAPSVLTSGSIVESAVVGSGRTMVNVEVDLIQGTHVQKILSLYLTGNDLAFFDPRTQHTSGSVTLTPEILSTFQPGPARLRAVAIGRHQWFRLPPPTVRELEVVIQKQ